MTKSSGLLALDTNVLLMLSRNKDPFTSALVACYPVFGVERAPIVSVVTMTELEGLCVRNKWCSQRITWLKKLYVRLNVIPIDVGPLLDEFVSLDNYQRLRGKNLAIFRSN